MHAEEPRHHVAAVGAGGEPQPRRTPLPDWFPFFLFAIVVGGLAYWASGPIGDPDTWWHLRLGDEFRGDWSLAAPGALSPFATRPWFATQWTLEVLASNMEDAFGLAGVSWLAGVGVVLFGVATYVSCRQRSAIAAASLAASMCLVGASLSFGPRPQLASFFFAAIVTTVWLRTMDDLRPRWWLVPLSWLWACTHGMWFVGVVIGVLVTVGLVLDGRLSRSTALRLSLVPLASVIAAAATPVGPKLVLAPLATSKMAEFVTEWQPPDLTEFVPAVAILALALVVGTWARGPRQSWSDVLLLGLAFGWVLLSYRTIAMGVTIAAPLVAGAIQSWLPEERLRVPRWERPAGIAAVTAILVGLTIAAPSREGSPLEELAQINAALSGLPPGTVVYNEYTLGGWLEWRHRNVSPTVDGMTDAYEVDHIAAYVDTKRLEPGWREFVAGAKAEYALLERDARLAAALAETGEWRVVVQESDYVLLRRAPARS
jgi:hypothetical protein